MIVAAAIMLMDAVTKTVDSSHSSNSTEAHQVRGEVSWSGATVVPSRELSKYYPIGRIGILSHHGQEFYHV